MYPQADIPRTSQPYETPENPGDPVKIACYEVSSSVTYKVKLIPLSNVASFTAGKSGPSKVSILLKSALRPLRYLVAKALKKI